MREREKQRFIFKDTVKFRGDACEGDRGAIPNRSDRIYLDDVRRRWIRWWEFYAGFPRAREHNYFTWDSICGNTRRAVIRRYPRFSWNQSVGTLRTYGRTKSGFQIYSLCYLISVPRWSIVTWSLRSAGHCHDRLDPNDSVRSVHD